MIYKSLETIPYKLFLKIVKTGDVLLLSDAEDDVSILSEIWHNLWQEHESKNNNPEDKKVFRISKNLETIKCQYKIILMACESLLFDWNDELVAMLHEFGYILRSVDTATYYQDVERIQREAEAYKSKINTIQKQLPKPSDDNTYKIDDIMASYSLILGFDFDYNLVSYSKYHALQNQVEAKIKRLETQNNKANAK